MVKIEPHEGHYRLTTEQWFPCAVGQVFPFFADAANLEAITPNWLGFRILTPLPVEMCRGLKLEYRISIHGIPVTWETEIEIWQPQERFVDVQRRGPYKLWRHEHRFAQHAGGTLMTDTVEYATPFRAIANFLIVKRALSRIFGYRSRALQDLFGG